MDEEAQRDLSPRRSNLIWSLIGHDAQSEKNSGDLMKKGGKKSSKKKKKDIKDFTWKLRQRETFLTGEKSWQLLRPADIFSNKKVLTALSGHGPSHRFTVKADDTTVCERGTVHAAQK